MCMNLCNLWWSARTSRCFLQLAQYKGNPHVPPQLAFRRVAQLLGGVEFVLQFSILCNGCITGWKLWCLVICPSNDIHCWSSPFLPRTLCGPTLYNGSELLFLTLYPLPHLGSISSHLSGIILLHPLQRWLEVQIVTVHGVCLLSFNDRAAMFVDDDMLSWYNDAFMSVCALVDLYSFDSDISISANTLFAL